MLAGCLHADGELLLLGIVANTAASLLGGLSPVGFAWLKKHDHL